MQHCALVSVAPDVLTEGVVVCISMSILIVLTYVVPVLVCMHFMFCLMCASVAFLCVLMCVVYL